MKEGNQNTVFRFMAIVIHILREFGKVKGLTAALTFKVKGFVESGRFILTFLIFNLI